MSRNENNTLSLEQTIEQLPDDFYPVEIIKRNKKLASSAKGIIVIRASREYVRAETIWWTCIKPELLEKEVQYVIIAIGLSGILVVPAVVILDFGRKYNVSKLKNGRQNIRIKKIRHVLSCTNRVRQQ